MAPKNEQVHFQASASGSSGGSFFELFNDTRKKAGKLIYFLDIWIIVHITMIAIGSLHLNQCSAEKFIPIYLIVGGVFGILKNTLNIVQNFKKTDDEEFNVFYLDKILNAFLFCWFIAGCVWIYKAYKPEFNDTSDAKYCNKVLYLFAFWLTNITLFLMVFSVVLCCAYVGCLFCRKN
ncbi:transmembrane protein 272-like isoform X2 [Centruroides vittatus]|uniref:transmembrane protein 272-like isoform X2 n=1 Tax=Centruroides vittatus TaxID=120091 RepID=UPI00350FC99C